MKDMVVFSLVWVAFVFYINFRVITYQKIFNLDNTELGEL